MFCVEVLPRIGVCNLTLAPPKVTAGATRSVAPRVYPRTHTFPVLLRHASLSPTLPLHRATLAGPPVAGGRTKWLLPQLVLLARARAFTLLNTAILRDDLTCALGVCATAATRATCAKKILLSH